MTIDQYYAGLMGEIMSNPVLMNSQPYDIATTKFIDLCAQGILNYIKYCEQITKIRHEGDRRDIKRFKRDCKGKTCGFVINLAAAWRLNLEETLIRRGY